ncbi:MAG: hypothetical protein U9O87_09220 [Verrucomicrobiota bacterium]|nr:hypothetical protein [Verrucomicrobiota bacterium]
MKKLLKIITLSIFLTTNSYAGWSVLTSYMNSSGATISQEVAKVADKHTQTLTKLNSTNITNIKNKTTTELELYQKILKNAKDTALISFQMKIQKDNILLTKNGIEDLKRLLEKDAFVPANQRDVLYQKAHQRR